MWRCHSCVVCVEGVVDGGRPLTARKAKGSSLAVFPALISYVYARARNTVTSYGLCLLGTKIRVVTKMFKCSSPV